MMQASLMTDDEMQQKKNMLRKEIVRRLELAQKHREVTANLKESQKEWWWCLESSLVVISKQLKIDYKDGLGGHVVIDNFLSEDLCSKISKEVKYAHKLGLLSTPGALGGGQDGKSSFIVDEKIRGDSLGWLDCTSLPNDDALSCYFEDENQKVKDELPVLEKSKMIINDKSDSFQVKSGKSERLDEKRWEGLTGLTQRMETLVAELGNFVTDLKGCKTRSRAMVTHYPKDSFYSRHIDNANRNGRRLTCIYYANEEPNDKDIGGKLRLYKANLLKTDNSMVNDEKSSGKHIKTIWKDIRADIESRRNRLVIFYSDERTPHEVLPVNSEQGRYAITTWFFDQEEKKKVKEQNNNYRVISQST